MLSYYEILQVKENASDADIKKAYRRLCKILHPDMHNNSKEANVIFNLLHEAYDTLSDSSKRRNYNPESHNPSSVGYDITIEKYDEIITGYKKIVKDYERIIKSKDKREKELLEEIRILKEGTEERTENDFSSFNNESSTQSTPYQEKLKEEFTEEDQKKGVDVWAIVIYTVLGLVLLGIFILLVIIPNVWWIIIFLVGLPIWLFFSAFK